MQQPTTSRGLSAAIISNIFLDQVVVSVLRDLSIYLQHYLPRDRVNPLMLADHLLHKQHGLITFINHHRVAVNLPVALMGVSPLASI